MGIDGYLAEASIDVDQELGEIFDDVENFMVDVVKEALRAGKTPGDATMTNVVRYFRPKLFDLKSGYGASYSSKNGKIVLGDRERADWASKALGNLKFKLSGSPMDALKRTVPSRLRGRIHHELVHRWQHKNVRDWDAAAAGYPSHTGYNFDKEENVKDYRELHANHGVERRAYAATLAERALIHYNSEDPDTRHNLKAALQVALEPSHEYENGLLGYMTPRNRDKTIRHAWEIAIRKINGS